MVFLVALAGIAGVLAVCGSEPSNKVAKGIGIVLLTFAAMFAALFGWVWLVMTNASL